MNPKTLKLIRQIHLYSGVLFAPAILFFAITGGLQTLNLHEPDHHPSDLMVRLSQIHKKAGSDFSKPAIRPPQPQAPGKPAPQPRPQQPLQHVPEKIFFVVVSIGLVLSTLSGLVMAWKYTRNKWLVAGTFLAGLVLPILFLFF